MVVSVLVHRFAPSSRGLQKRQRGAQQQHHYYDFADNTTTQNNNYYPSQDHYDPHPITATTMQQHEQQRIRNASNTAHRRKPFKAMTCLTSLAADIDIVSDWCFYLHARATDQQCRREQNNAFLIPPLLINLVLTSCIVGTVLWVILATDGRIAAPILRRLGIDKLSMGLVLLLCVFFEDIPQIVLTFMIEDYYDQGGYLSEMALWNVSASLYDSLLKLAEAYDERHDLVETGAWCKHSLYNAHGTNRVVTAVLALPPPPPFAAAAAVSSSHSTSSTSSATRTPVGTTTNHTNHTEPPPTMSQPPLPSMPPLWFGPAPEASLLLPQPRVLPPLRFLSASVEEDVIKLWNCTNSNSSSSSNGSALMTSTAALNQPFTTAATITTTNRPVAAALDVTPVVTVHCHGEFLAPKVTCLALLWLRTTVDERTTATLGQTSAGTTTATDGATDTAAICFLSGCSNGQVQLWNSDTGLCWRTFHDPIAAAAAVSSLAALSDHCFVAGYQDGTARVWQISTGQCQGVYYHGSSTTVGAVCSLNDGVSFVTGSDDKMLRLWSVTSRSPSTTTITTTTPETVHPLPSAATSSTGSSSWWKALLRRSPSNVSTTTPDQLNHNSHNLDSNSVFSTPYVQYTDSLPIIHHEHSCEKVFVGHTGAVLSVTCLGGETLSSSSRALVLVSGSRDGTARLWSVVDGTCWQVFRGHSASVTTVTAMDDVTLLTGSADATIKVWDVGSGKCLRTFEGHTAAVTGLSTTHDDSTTFVSSSVDGSVKIWVLTAVGQEDVEQPRAALWEDALDANDSWCCRGIDPD